MPVTTSAQQVPAIVQWFQVYGNIVYFFAQMLWWLVTGFAAGWAACLYYRWVKYNTKGPGAVARTEKAEVLEDDDDFDAKPKSAGDEPKKDEPKKDSDKDKDKVDVDEFVD